MRIVNKTPHPIYLVNENSEVVRTFPACKTEELIRLSSQTVPHGELDGVPVTTTEFGEAVGLPAFEHDVYYIVSQLVKGAQPNRTDLLVPAEVERDSAGQILGCRSLGK